MTVSEYTLSSAQPRKQAVSRTDPRTAPISLYLGTYLPKATAQLVTASAIPGPTP